MNAIETKHTPGPWRYEANTKTIRSVPSNYWIATMDSWDGAVNHTANAALIAQAPDLLAERDRLRQVNAELVAALDRLIFAAECRDNTMGDQSRLIDVKASLVAATVLARSVSFEAKHARAALAKAQAE